VPDTATVSDTSPEETTAEAAEEAAPANEQVSDTEVSDTAETQEA